jgi:CheY-like chemotaxis protein
MHWWKRLISFRWSIVNQLGGKIAIRSELGKGTDVELTIPVEKSTHGQILGTLSDSTNILSEAEECISKLRDRVAGKSICFSRGNVTDISHQKDVSWACMQRYCTEWFGFEAKNISADLVITDREEATWYNDGQRVLIVHDDMACSTKHNHMHTRHAIGNICSPIGPFKLARSIHALLDQDITIPQSAQKPVNKTDAGTQTPLGSPEERTIMNGIILTDYGFTPPSLSTLPPVMETDHSPSPLAAWSIQQQPRVTESFTSITTLSLAESPAPTLSTFPAFPQPRMTLTLPNPKVVTQSPSTTSKPPSNGLYILAVDDNALNLQLLHRYLLKRDGDTIVTAKNGIEAVYAVKTLGLGKGFDVIFMDISMPEMDGFEATRVIRSYENSQLFGLVGHENGVGQGTRAEGKRKRAYVVALTGLASRRDRDLADECGFDDFLTKPISFKRIGELLRGLSRNVT